MAAVVSDWSERRYEVPDSEVGAYESEGYAVIDRGDPEPESDPEPEEQGGDEARGDDGSAPDDGWTIPEIRAYARERGVSPPKGGRKSDLLAALEGR